MRVCDWQVLYVLTLVRTRDGWRGSRHVARDLGVRFGGEWYGKKVERVVYRLRRDGLVRVGSLSVVPERVLAVARADRCDASVGFLARDVERYLVASEGDMWDVAEQMIREWLA